MRFINPTTAILAVAPRAAVTAYTEKCQISELSDSHVLKVECPAGSQCGQLDLDLCLGVENGTLAAVDQGNYSKQVTGCIMLQKTGTLKCESNDRKMHYAINTGPVVESDNGVLSCFGHKSVECVA